MPAASKSSVINCRVPSTTENDAHYVIVGVKLGTPDHPILWYKPTDAERYRVVYADLSVKELAPDEVKKLSHAKSK